MAKFKYGDKVEIISWRTGQNGTANDVGKIVTVIEDGSCIPFIKFDDGYRTCMEEERLNLCNSNQVINTNVEILIID